MNKNSKLKILLYIAFILVALYTLLTLFNSLKSIYIVAKYNDILNFRVILSQLFSLFINLIDKVVLILLLISLFTKNKIFRIISASGYLLIKLINFVISIITYIALLLDNHYIASVMTYYHFSYFISFISYIFLFILIIILILGIFIKGKGKKFLLISNIIVSALALLHAIFGNIILIIIYNSTKYLMYGSRGIWDILRILIINPAYLLIPSICLMSIYLGKEGVYEK